MRQIGRLGGKLDGIEAGAEVNTVKSIIGGDGITAADSSGDVTVTADPNTNKGVEIADSKIAVKLGTGLAFDSSGKIENTVTGGLLYKGTVDVTSTTIPAAVQNDLYANTGAGKFSSDWAAVTSNADTTTDAAIGDWIIFNGTDWDHIPSSGGGLTETEADGRYLRVDAAAGDQIRLSGEANFRDTVSLGPNKEIELNVNGSATFGTAGANNVYIYGDGSADFKGLTTHENGVNVTGGNLNVGPGKIIALSTEQIGISSNLTTANSNTTLRGFQCGSQPGVTAQEIYGFQVSGNLNTNATATTRLAAFNSGIQANGDINYNIYAPGNAPNFLAGSTYIGGDTTRNTFELWKSTLTEQQLEQLEAGTLVAPANVSLPGDGEFARQWWYNQQSAEDQALIDSGELDYPEHFAASTFTDTFDLGDNTRINLYSNGLGEFKGGVQVSGGSSDVTCGITSGAGSNYPLFIRANGTEVARFTDKAGGTVYGVNLLVRNSIIDSTVRSATGYYSNFKNTNLANVTTARGFSTYLESNADTTDSCDTFVGFSALSSDDTGFATNAYGFESKLNTFNATECYNFYASGDAPNFLQGSTYIGGNTTRNTFELWKSTLTEEQLEQLEAGTLAGSSKCFYSRRW